MKKDFWEIHDRSISDKYLSFGWVDNKDNRVIKFGIPYNLANIKNMNSNNHIRGSSGSSGSSGLTLEISEKDLCKNSSNIDNTSCKNNTNNTNIYHYCSGSI